MRMIASRIRKHGNSYVVTIPREEMEKRGLVEGQLVGFDPIPVELRPVGQERTELRPEVRAAAERVWAKNEAGLRYLAGR
jgi:antitoxin component of MazEF toxin-antitoxin module